MQKSDLKELDKELGKALRDARKKCGKTQLEIAEAIHSPQSFVAKYECGERILSAAEFVFLAGLVGLNWRKTFSDLLPNADS